MRCFQSKGAALAVFLFGVSLFLGVGCDSKSGPHEPSTERISYGEALRRGLNPARPERISLGIGDVTIEVEVAGKGAGLQLGLMFRKSLGENEGMWFEFENEDYRRFWMRNTRIPLSIAFVDTEGRITNIEEMIPYDETGVRSREKARYALEMKRGWFKRHGVRAGDIIRIGKKRRVSEFPQEP